MITYPLVTVIEGKTKVLVPNVEAFRKSPSSFPSADAPVFYNKRMEINRDFALAALRVYLKNYCRKDPILYCEPMAGSGIRSIRVANELQDILIHCNDINPEAVALINENVKQLALDKKILVSNNDANNLMIQNGTRGNKFSIIDIDPFGSPAPFMESAVQAIAENGLLAVTSTDMATMCGVYPQACIRKYYSKPIHTWIAHEVAVRMQIGFIVILLARHGKNAIPLFAHSTEHFIRTYILAEKGITKAKETINELGFISHCPHCFSIDFSKGFINKLIDECPNCHKIRIIGGPVWLSPIYEAQFVNKLDEEINAKENTYGTIKSMKKILDLIKEEVTTSKVLKANICYYDVHRICDGINLNIPKIKSIIEKLHSMKYLASRTHFRLNSIKTDAPPNIIIEIIKNSQNI